MIFFPNQSVDKLYCHIRKTLRLLKYNNLINFLGNKSLAKQKWNHSDRVTRLREINPSKQKSPNPP